MSLEIQPVVMMKNGYYANYHKMLITAVSQTWDMCNLYRWCGSSDNPWIRNWTTGCIYTHHGHFFAAFLCL